jgi:DNA-directed RNA polymerase subunit RPC12/RpoP
MQTAASGRPITGVELLSPLRCANCGLGYIASTFERLLLASSGASCPSCGSPLSECHDDGLPGARPAALAAGWAPRPAATFRRVAWGATGLRRASRLNDPEGERAS